MSIDEIIDNNGVERDVWDEEAIAQKNCKLNQVCYGAVGKT